MNMLKHTGLWLLAAFPAAAWADPLDNGEAYTTRAAPPEWMDKVDVAWLLADYAVFALSLIAIGWLLFRRPQYVLRLESMLRMPFEAVFAAAKDKGGMMEIILQLFGTLLVFIVLGAWVFFCQWLKHMGLATFSMIGLAAAAVLLVRLLKGNERAVPVP